MVDFVTDWLEADKKNVIYHYEHTHPTTPNVIPGVPSGFNPITGQPDINPQGDLSTLRTMRRLVPGRTPLEHYIYAPQEHIRIKYNVSSYTKIKY